MFSFNHGKETRLAYTRATALAILTAAILWHALANFDKINP
jgi:hypothetical protein